MKKFKLITALLSSALILAGCNGEDPKPVDECDHVMKDTNQDGTCDSCQKEVGHADADNNGKCDYCGKDMQEPAEPTVKSVSIEGKVAELEIGKTVDLTANIVVENGAAQGIKWSVSNDNASLSATSGKDVTVTGLKAGKVTVKAASTFDPTKFDEVEIEVKEPEVTDWSDEDKQKMEAVIGQVLPFFKGDFEWGVFTYQGSYILEAESSNEDDLQNALDAFDALEVKKEEKEGVVIYTMPSSVEDYEIIVQVYADDGVAYVDAFLSPIEYSSWPADRVAAFIGDHTEEVVPAADGSSFMAYIKEYSTFDALVVDITGDGDAYLAKLQEAGWKINDFTETSGYYDCYSPEHYLELVLFADTGSFEIQLILSEPLAPEFPSEVVSEYIGDYSEDTVPAAEGTGFENFISSTGALCINVTGGDEAAYLAQLVEAGYTLHEKVDLGGEGYMLSSPSGDLDMFIWDMDAEGTAFQIQLILTEAPELEAFPEENVNNFLSASTIETIVDPEADGYDDKGVLGISSTYYEVIARYCDCVTYALALQNDGWTLNTSYYSSYHMIQATSPLGSIQLQLWDNGDSFDLDIYLVNEAYSEWPTAKVAEMCEGNTEVEIPAAEGSGFSVKKNSAESFYFGVIKVAGASVEDYLGVLETNGFEYYYDSDYKCYTAHKGDLALDLFGGTDGATLSIQAYGYVAPAAVWPAEEIASFLGDSVTETVLAPVTATSFVAQEGAGYYQVTVNGGNSAEYVAALKEANYVVDDSMYDAYFDYYGYGIYFVTSPEGQFTMQIVDVANYMIGIFPVATEWNEEDLSLMNELIGEPMPFFSGIDYWDNYYGKLEGAIEDESALDAIFAALEDDGWTGGYDEYEYEYIYTKESTVNPGNVLTAEIYDWGGDWYIDVSVEEPAPAPITEWPAEQIATLLGEKAKTAVPECEGTEYEITPYTDGCDIYVVGGDFDAYVEVLTKAGFTFVESRPDSYPMYFDYISEDGTVLLTICNAYDGAISIMAFAIEPKEEGAEFPSEQVDADLFDCYGVNLGSTPLPEGTSFSYELVSKMYPTVTVTGGDRAAYVDALLNAGFVLDNEASAAYGCDAYKNDTLEVYVYSEDEGGTYKVEFGAIYEPVDW